jgi:hypothetical protein
VTISNAARKRLIIAVAAQNTVTHCTKSKTHSLDALRQLHPHLEGFQAGRHISAFPGEMLEEP